VVVFWVVTPCSAVVGYQRFRGPCCLHFTLKMQAAWAFETLVTYHKHHSRESFKARDLSCPVFILISFFRTCICLSCHTITDSQKQHILDIKDTFCPEFSIETDRAVQSNITTVMYDVYFIVSCSFFDYQYYFQSHHYLLFHS
jgi:hypothetical protein